jgi:hypothetical protein
MFVGYPRSGHSLVGQLLNAHRCAVIAHERHALRDLMWGYTPKQIFAFLLRSDREFADSCSRHWTGYDYRVPDSWQGSYTRLKVIGDKRGGASTRTLTRHPELFEQLRKLSQGRQLRVIHHVRNPYDNISTIARRSGMPLDEAVLTYFKWAAQARSHLDRIEELPEAATIETHHEDLIANPHEVLTRLTRFLGLTPHAEYLRSCADVIYDSPHKSRHEVSWPLHLRETVARRLQSFTFLADYSFGEDSDELA